MKDMSRSQEWITATLHRGRVASNWHHTQLTPPMESLETQPYNSQPYNLPRGARDPTLQQPPPLEIYSGSSGNLTT